MATRKKPTPVAVTTICSVCGLDWTLHGEDATTDDCIKLLKAELAKRPAVRPYAYPMPVYPYGEPLRPYRGTESPVWTTNETSRFRTPLQGESKCISVERAA